MYGYDNPSEAFAYEAGWNCYEHGEPFSNGHGDTVEAVAWRKGWKAAQRHDIKVNAEQR